jgi:hypothetical protein
MRANWQSPTKKARWSGPNGALRERVQVRSSLLVAPAHGVCPFQVSRQVRLIAAVVLHAARIGADKLGKRVPMHLPPQHLVDEVAAVG